MKTADTATQSRIGLAILKELSLRRRWGTRQFRGFHVANAARRACSTVAPGTADRILRKLRARGLIDYRCLDRNRSLYLDTTKTKTK